jgi:hypothetical protein
MNRRSRSWKVGTLGLFALVTLAACVVGGYDGDVGVGYVGGVYEPGGYEYGGWGGGYRVGPPRGAPTPCPTPRAASVAAWRWTNSGRRCRGCSKATVVLELALGKYVEAAVIAGLLLFNAGSGCSRKAARRQRSRPEVALALTASVRRDGAWTTLPAAGLVPGDVIKLSLGGVVAADAADRGRRLARPVDAHRRIGADRSRLPACRPSPAPWCGAARPRPRSRRPACAPNSAAPRNWSARPMSSARSRRPSCASCATWRLSTACVIVAAGALCRGVGCRFRRDRAARLTAVLARSRSPCRRPSRWRRRSARGAGEIGVLPTRLSAVDEAANDGRAVRRQDRHADANALTVASVHPMPGFDAAHVLALAALASSDGGQDPVDAPFAPPPASPPMRRTWSGQVRPLRSRDENVGGDGHDAAGGRATRGEGCLRRGQRLSPNRNRRRGRGRRQARGAGLPRAGSGGGDQPRR